MNLTAKYLIILMLTSAMAVMPKLQSFQDKDPFLRRGPCLKDYHCKNQGICQNDGRCLCTSNYTGQFCETPVSQTQMNAALRIIHKRQSFDKSCAFPIKIESSLPNGGSISLDYRFKEYSGRVTTTNDINYSCNFGSSLVGSLTISCSPNGEWAIIPPACVQAQRQQAFSNDGSSQVIAARVECSAKRVIAGQDLLVCDDNWTCSSHVPICRISPTPVPTSMGNIQDTQSDTGEPCRPGDTMRHTCPEGWRLSGSALRYCLENGQWDQASPSCGRVCTLPFSVNKNKVAMSGLGMNYRYEESGKRFTAVTNVWFRCNRGYVVTGSLLISCTGYGEWDVNLPTCVRSSQSSPNSVTEIVARVECSERSVLASQSIMVCANDGLCESGVPACTVSPTAPASATNPPVAPAWKPSAETRPPPPRHTIPTMPPSVMPSFTTTAPLPLETTFVPPLPQAQPPNFCPLPSELPNGSYRITLPNSSRRNRPENMVEVDTAIQYSCRPPYELRGPSERICLPSGDWSDQEPSCKPVCGVSEPKTPQIIGGRPAPKNGYPWQVAVKRLSSGIQNQGITCGGVILSDRWVLSAAHCVTEPQSTQIILNSDLLLYFGRHFVNPNLDAKDVVTRKVMHIMIHDNYDPIILDSDLGLMYLESSLGFTDKVLPICLPPPNSLATFQEGRKGMVTGWGYIDKNYTAAKEMMLIELPIVSNSKCQESYDRLDVRTSVTDNMFCAGPDQGGANTCLGDSGGPMVFYDNGHYVLEGIVSWGMHEDCAGPGYYGGFVRVRNFVHWIVRYVSP